MMPPIDYTHLIAVVIGLAANWLYSRMNSNQPAPAPAPSPNTPPPLAPQPANPLFPGGLQIGNGQLLSLLLAALMAKPPQQINIPGTGDQP